MSDADRWDARYRAGAGPTEPSRVLVDLAPILPRTGRAVDLAGGAGRHAIWLERRGLAVTLVDASAEGLQLARRRGFGGEVVHAELPDGVPPGPWDLALVLHYLDRPLLRRIPAELAPGGLLVVVHPTRRNLERHEHPSARWLLDEGELPGLVPGLDILRHEEGWSVDDRHEAVLVARRPPGR